MVELCPHSISQRFVPPDTDVDGMIEPNNKDSHPSNDTKNQFYQSKDT